MRKRARQPLGEEEEEEEPRHVKRRTSSQVAASQLDDDPDDYDLTQRPVGQQSLTQITEEASLGCYQWH